MPYTLRARACVLVCALCALSLSAFLVLLSLSLSLSRIVSLHHCTVTTTSLTQSPICSARSLSLSLCPHVSSWSSLLSIDRHHPLSSIYLSDAMFVELASSNHTALLDWKWKWRGRRVRVASLIYIRRLPAQTPACQYSYLPKAFAVCELPLAGRSRTRRAAWRDTR